LILYTEVLDLITKYGNKNHNPFKQLIKKIDWFIENNKLTVEGLLLQLNRETKEPSVETFANFLKSKVDKTRDLDSLLGYSKLLDIDKNGRICKNDLQTCLLNLNSD